jgi:hypothetical protein
MSLPKASNGFCMVSTMPGAVSAKVPSKSNSIALIIAYWQLALLLGEF